MVTTKDCKLFLVDIAEQHPYVFENVFGTENERTLVSTSAKKVSCWKRETKFNGNNEEHDFFEPEYNIFTEFDTFRNSPWHAIYTETLPADQVKWVRVFVCDPSQFEDAVKFLVIESLDGKLHLGNYVGD